MTWHHCLRIADILIGIDSTCDAFTRIAREMLSPYESTPVPPDQPCALHFRVTHGERGSQLFINDELLWSSHDIGELLASFEVNLYQQAIAQLTPRFASIHAAAVAIGDTACIFAGSSGAGKSSICTEAVLSGVPYMSDEFALLDKTGNIAPFPRPLQWERHEHPAFSHRQMLTSGKFGRAEFSFPTPNGERLQSQLWLPRNVQHRSLPLRHVVLHRFDPQADDASLVAIRRSEALMELPQNLHQQSRPDIMLKLLNQRIPPQTHFYRLVFPDVHRAWEIFEQQCQPARA